MKSWTPDQTLHSAIFALCFSVIFLSVVLTPSPEGVSLFGIPAPPLCMWSQLTGSSCPGCGLTRSFTYMGHGQIVDAFRMHKLGPLGWAFVATMIPWHGVKMVRAFRRPAAA